jgi:hypothetical protein
MVLGNNNVKLRIGDKTVEVPPSSSAIGLQVTAKGQSKLFSPHWPKCTG